MNVVFLAMAVAGGIGAVCRFALDGWITAHVRTAIPVGTLIINVLGSLLLGLLTGIAATHLGFAPYKVILGTGLAGGFTTFSTASVEGANLLISEGAPTWRGVRRAAMHAGLMLIASIAAAWLGAVIGG